MRALEFVTESAKIGKLAKSGKIVRIYRREPNREFDGVRDWMLVDMDPAKGVRGQGLKWIPGNTRFEWVRDYLEKVDEERTLESTIPQDIEEFLDSLNPDDVGVEEFGPYRVHYEGFTDDCQSSADYCANPEAVYQQVFADHIAREGGRRPIEQNFTGDEDYPILYSIFKRKKVNEEKTLDPEVYGEMLPTATVKQIVTRAVKQVDPVAKVSVKQSPEGYYICRSEGLRLDFGITADGGDINANIVNAYSSYKGAGIVTQIFGECFRAAEQLWGTPQKFVMSAHEDRGHGVWQHIAQKLGAKWEGSINEIYKIPQGDFGDADTLTPPKHAVKKKPLPGGSGFTYAVDKKNSEELEIMIFDGEALAAELDLFDTQDVTGAWRVSTVAVNPEYRSQGLGKALYGIALNVLKLTLEAGDTQTRHGQRMWLMLNSIPGVEVVGYSMEPTDKYQARSGDKIIDQTADWTRYTFPVRPGTHSMRSTRRGTGMYTSQASMLAKWTGQ